MDHGSFSSPNESSSKWRKWAATLHAPLSAFPKTLGPKRSTLLHLWPKKTLLEMLHSGHEECCVFLVLIYHRLRQGLTIFLKQLSVADRTGHFRITTFPFALIFFEPATLGHASFSKITPAEICSSRQWLRFEVRRMCFPSVKEFRRLPPTHHSAPQHCAHKGMLESSCTSAHGLLAGWDERLCKVGLYTSWYQLEV